MGVRGYEKLEKVYIGGTRGRNGKRKRYNYIVIKIKEKDCTLGSSDPHPQHEKPGVSAGYNLSQPQQVETGRSQGFPVDGGCFFIPVCPDPK